VETAARASASRSAAPARARRPAAPFGEPEPARLLAEGAAPGGMEEVWALPRLVSLHHKQ
jgi:hypothetical protein